jgi:long-subunit acyl-CoA synthetase (AMP-forming)
LTSKTLVDGWLYTGDKGYLDRDKYLYITGRVSDSFKTSKGEFIEPLTLESHFADIQEIEEICITGLGLAQPIGLVQLSEIGKLTLKDELSEILEVKLADINADLENYKKISTLVIVKDEWTEQNKILGPTLKIKRGNVEEMYSSKYILWTSNNSKIIWE